ncbi:MAG: hypothetical protein H7257_12905, partial [Taibaiella sp.]|nr:hypothetical protein [Taibaiella sp.]
MHRFIKLTALCCVTVQAAFAQNITTVAGTGTRSFSGDGGQATAAAIANPYGVAVDASGNIYIADLANQRIRKVNTSGVITTIAGTGSAGFSGDGGQATAAALHDPVFVTVDGRGNVYISDVTNQRIRKVNGSGIITTVAGSGTVGFSGDGGQATNAAFAYPTGAVTDGIGNLYIADQSNNRIRKVDASGVVTTIAGTGSAGFSGDGGPATAATMNQPYSMAVDGSGNVYIGDRNNSRIRKVTTSGVITTVAGNGGYGYSGDGGAATAATLNSPEGVVVDGSGNIYITDQYNARVRKVNASGVISTVVGNGTSGYSGDGGAATAAQIVYPGGLGVDVSGNLYIADLSGNSIRKVINSSVTNRVPSFFSGGYRFGMCQNSGTYNLNYLLRVRDVDTGQTLSWSLVSGPSHGTCSLSYSTTSTGGTVMPAGLAYTPALDYNGLDSIKVRISDGAASGYITLTITVFPTPSVAVISGPASVCAGESIALSSTETGGTWSTA